MLSLNYAISKEDYVFFYTYMMWDSPENAGKRNWFYVRQLLPPILFLLAFYYTGLFNRSNQFVLLIVGFLALTVITSLKSARGNTVRQAEKIANDPGNESMFSNRSLQVSDAGITVQDELSETRYRWKAFCKRMESERYFFLFTNNVQAIIIPKRAFTSSDQLQQFEKMLTQHLSIDAEFGRFIKS